MTGSNTGSKSAPSTDQDVASLNIAQDEARTVLDHQIGTLNDIDAKAAQTFRLDAIFIGLLLTSASLLARADAWVLDSFVNRSTTVGVVLLILSFVFAILTYTTARIETGIGPAAIEHLVAQNHSESRWLTVLLRSEATWMRINERQLTINSTLLALSHIALVGAVVSISVGVVR